MRLDVTSAKMRKRLVAELSAQHAEHAKEPAPHDAPVHPEAMQPKPQHDPQRLVKWAQAALSVVLGLRLPLDGVLGGTTQMAVRRFQTQAGLPQTGALDETTVLALAKAVGHPAPGMSPEHKLMPRWFRQERQQPRGRAHAMAQKKSQSPDDAWSAETPPQHAELPKPVAPEKAALPELTPHKKPRPEGLL